MMMARRRSGIGMRAMVVVSRWMQVDGVGVGRLDSQVGRWLNE